MEPISGVQESCASAGLVERSSVFAHPAQVGSLRISVGVGVRDEIGRKDIGDLQYSVN